MESKLSKEELIGAWKNAFKYESFLKAHGNRAPVFSPATRDISISGMNLRILNKDSEFFIYVVGEEIESITQEEFKELFDLYESIPQLTV